MVAELSLPDPEERQQAEFILKELTPLADSHTKNEIKLVFRRGSKELALPFPASALNLLMKILDQMALGNSVTLIPVHAQLTTQEAADLLNVSRPFVVKLLNDGVMPFFKVGAHRRIRFEDLMDYKKSMLSESEKARQRLAELGQELQQDD